MSPSISLVRDPVVFLSSTSDLRDERDAVVRELRPLWQVYDYREDSLAAIGNRSPEDRLREVLSRTDVVVGILGPRYGTPIDVGGTRRSVVQWEFEEAARVPTILIFPFIKKLEDHDAADPEQLAFLRELQEFRAKWCRFFGTPGDLGTLALREMAALSELRRRELAGLMRTRYRRLFLPLIVVIAACGALVLLAALTQRVSATGVIVAGVALTAATAMAVLLLGALRQFASR